MTAIQRNALVALRWVREGKWDAIQKAGYVRVLGGFVRTGLSEQSSFQTLERIRSLSHRSSELASPLKVYCEAIDCAFALDVATACKELRSVWTALDVRVLEQRDNGTPLYRSFAHLLSRKVLSTLSAEVQDQNVADLLSWILDERASSLEPRKVVDIRADLVRHELLGASSELEAYNILAKLHKDDTLATVVAAVKHGVWWRYYRTIETKYTIPEPTALLALASEVSGVPRKYAFLYCTALSLVRRSVPPQALNGDDLETARRCLTETDKLLQEHRAALDAAGEGKPSYHSFRKTLDVLRGRLPR